MLLSTPATLMFYTSLTISSLMAIASSNWIMAWMAMEINLISFIPIIHSHDKNQETEACIKYFLAQALGSALMLMSSMSLWSKLNNKFIWLVLVLALLMKLGAAPCHFWLPSVMTSSSWTSSMILVTWQKLAPLSLLIFAVGTCEITNSFLVLAASMNAIIGGTLGLNQVHMRTILAYSSITHMGWMIGALSLAPPTTPILYFIMYSAIVIPLFIILNMMNTVNPSQLIKSNPLLGVLAIILLLSLSGLPPFTGFVPKWLVIASISYKSSPLLLMLIMGSLMNLYFYLNISFSALLSMMHSSHPSLTLSGLQLTALPVTLALTSLGAIPMLMYAMTLLN